MTHSLENTKYGYLVLATLAGLGLSTVQAQNATDDVVELEKRVVTTGSYIPTAGETPVAPVTFITQNDIKVSGVSSSLLEVIRKTTPQFVGNSNLGQSNGNIASGATGGGSFISLRNTRTLVLINGRRAAISPIAGSGGFNNVDVNTIPVSAVERIEVLNDGASAVYGADATSGVVNIILKKNFQGAEISGRYSFSDNDGNYEERNVSAAVGASSGKTSITVTAEWNKLDPLFQKERDFSNPSYGTPSFAGVINIGSKYYVLKPGLNAPPLDTDKPIDTLVSEGIYVGPFTFTELAFNEGAAAGYGFNLANYVTLLLRKESRIGTVAIEHKISDNMTLFADFLYSRTMTLSQINAQPLGTNSFFNAPGTHPYNPLPADVTVRVRNRFVENPRRYYYDTTGLRALGGLRGKITEKISYESAVNFNEVNQSYQNKGVYDLNTLIAAAGLTANAQATAGQRPIINLFAINQAPGALEASNAAGTAYSDFTSRLNTFDARVFGDLFEIPMGYVGFATGIEYRRELLTGDADLNSIPDANGVIKWAGATSIQPFRAKREVNSIFAEFKVPLVGPEQDIKFIHRADLDFAVRHERYSDTDDPTVKKVSLRLEVVENELVLRGNWGESFTAPTLYSMFGPTDQGFTDPIVITPAGGGAKKQLGQAQQRGGANPNLSPATSTSFGLGFVFTPKAVEGLSLEVNYFNITEDDLVGGIPSETIAQDVEDKGPASPYSQYLRFGSFEGSQVTAPGQLYNTPDIENVYITVNSQNIASQKLDGFDFVLKYARMFDFGKIDFVSTWTYFNSYKYKLLPTEPEEESAGRATNFNGTIPEYRVYNTVTFTKGPMQFTLGHQYIPSMPYENSPGPKMEAYTTFDVSVGYTFGQELAFLEGLSLRVGVNNIGNEMPPLAPELYDQSNADIDTYDPIGRLFFIEGSYKF